MRVLSRYFVLLVVIPCLLLPAKEAAALEIINTLPTGSQSASVAVNPVTNKAYVANAGANTVTVIDNATSAVAATINVESNPCAVAVNPLTNTIYVANKASNTVSIIDGVSNSVTSVPVGAGPCAIAINGTSGEIYVANGDGGSVSQMSGSSVTKTYTVGSKPNALAVNPVTNKIYAANSGGASVSAIDRAAGTVKSIATGSAPVAIVVNTATNMVYTANSAGNNVTVINGATDAVAQTVAADTTPSALAVNQVTNKIYVANRGSHKLTLIDGADYSKATIQTPYMPSAIAINPGTNMIFVANEADDRISVIDGARTGAGYAKYLQQKPGSVSRAIAINTVTNLVFVANEGTGSVDIVDATVYTASTGIALPSRSFYPIHNPVTNKFYIPSNDDPGYITVVDGNTDQIEAKIPTPEPHPYHLCINPVTNKIYVGYSWSDKIHVIDGTTRAIKEILLPAFSYFRGFSLNSAANRIYLSGSLTWIIDGVTDSITVSTGPSGPATINEATNKIYLPGLDYTALRVLDGNTNKLIKGNYHDAGTVSINPITNMAYLTKMNPTTYNTAWVKTMDGITEKAEDIPGLSSLSDVKIVSITPNIATNKLYAVYATRTDNTLIEIDGATNRITHIPNPSAADERISGINSITNTIFVTDGKKVAGFNGATRKNAFEGSFALTRLGGLSGAVVNPIDNSYYASDGDKLFTLHDQPGMETGIRIHFDPVPNHSTFLARPALTGKAVNRPNGSHSGIAAVYHQMHTTQSQWMKATITANAGSDSIGWTLDWGSDSLRFGLNYIAIAALDSQAASATLIYPIYRIRELPPRPGIPELIFPADNATDIRQNTVAAWTKVDDAVTYELRKASDPEFTKDLSVKSDLSDPSDSILSFRYGTFYYWKVRAINLGGFGEWSSVRHFTTIISPPSYPLAVEPADHKTDVTIPTTLVWRRSATATLYQAQLDTTSNFNSPRMVSATTADTTVAVPELATGRKYFWRIRAQNMTGWGGWSYANDFTTMPAEPATPQLLAPSAGAVDQPVWVALKWNKAARATSYHVQVGLDSAFTSLSLDDSTVSDTTKQSDLKKATAYFWRVRARNGGGVSSWSPSRKFESTNQDAPEAPVLLSPLENAVDRPYPVSFSWNRTATALTYHVQASKDSGFAKVADQDSLVYDTSAHLFMLSYSAPYYWRARAKNKGGTGPWSGYRTFTTGMAPPVYPILLSPANGAVDMPSPLAFRWTPGKSATSYDLEISSDSSFDVRFRLDSLLKDTTASIGGFKAGMSYFWRVRGVNPGGTGVWSPASRFAVGASVSIPETYSISGFGLFPSNRELRYSLPKRSFVNVAYYDLHGRFVATLVNKTQNPGYYSISIGEALAGKGTLIQIFKAGDFESRGKVVVLE